MDVTTSTETPDPPTSHFVLDLRFGDVSLPVLIVRGEVLRAAVTYARNLAVGGASQSSLSKAVRAIGLLLDFWNTAWERKPLNEMQGPRFLSAFFNGLLRGTIGSAGPESHLNWKPCGLETAKAILGRANAFLDFYQREFGSPDLNKSDVSRASWREQQASYNRQLKYNLLAHLFPHTQIGRGLKKRRAFTPISIRSSKSEQAKQVRMEDAFPADRFGGLVTTARTTRDKILYLLLGAGGMRGSEACGLFLHDVQPTAPDQGRVILADPEFGAVLGSVDDTAPPRLMSRYEFLKNRYQLLPRNRLPKSDPLHLGWKGMLIEDGERRWSEVLWLAPAFERLFWHLHANYMREIRSWVGDRHPYYFVSLRGDSYGEPLKLGNIRILFRQACARLGIYKQSNLHSLRHFYGMFAANVLNVPVEVIQEMMHHMSIESSRVYARLRSDVVRSYLRDAFDKLTAVSPDIVETLPSAFQSVTTQFQSRETSN